MKNQTIYYDECPICLGVISNWATKNQFKISKCRVCSFAFINPRPTLDFLKDFYSECGHEVEITSVEEALEREREYPNTTVDAHRIISFLSNNLRNSESKNSLTLLDVGSGYGFFSREATNQGFKVTGLEIAENERAIYTHLVGNSPILSTFEDFSSECHYDAILMSQILEHAIDINLWISKAYQMLSPGGILAIALPNFNSFLRYSLRKNDPYICPPAHLNFFNKKSLTALLKKKGFKILHIDHVSRIEKSVISKQLRVNGFLLDVLEIIISKCVLKIFDTGGGCSMMLNVYAKKE